MANNKKLTYKRKYFIARSDALKFMIEFVMKMKREFRKLREVFWGKRDCCWCWENMKALYEFVKGTKKPCRTFYCQR